MYRFIVLAILTLFFSCSDQTETILEGSSPPKLAKYQFLFSQNSIKTTFDISAKDKSALLSNGINTMLIKNKKTLIDGHQFSHGIPDFSDCFEGTIEEAFECLQNYVGQSEIIYPFDPTIPDNPESVAINSSGDFIISMALSGEVVKITRSGERELIATLPIGNFIPGRFTGLMGALTLDDKGNIYVNVNAEDPTLRGVWKVAENGESSLLAQLPRNAVPNGITLVGNYLYVADSGLDGKVWRVSVKSGAAEVWANDPLLKLINLDLMKPGPNGIQYYKNEIYVANPNQNLLLAIKLNKNGTSGDIRVISDQVTFDDFAIDILGNVIGTTDPLNTIEKIYPNGTKQILLTVDNGLDGPTAATFGKTFEDSFNLYVTNAAFPFFTETFTPSLMKLELAIPGYKY